jgi:hypothetical protein
MASVQKSFSGQSSVVVVPRRMKCCAPLIEAARVVDGDTTCERGFSIRTLTKTGQRYWLGDSLLAALMIIDVNGPDIERVDEVR